MSYGKLSLWYSSLPNTSQEEVWRTPIKEGKWCPAELVAHLMRWDDYLLTVAFPQAAANSTVDFPHHDTYNAVSTEYARSVTPDTILKSAIATRNKLLSELTEMSESYFFQPVTINGVTHYPEINIAYSIGK